MLAFYNDDLKIFKARLEEVVSKNTNRDLLALAEHFQNQFIIQKNEMDELTHAINEAEATVEAAINHNETAINRQRLPDDGALRNRVAQFEKLFHELRSELMIFLSKNM
jgi:hypothetical protein